MEDITSHGDLDDVYMWIGPDLHLVQYPVRRGELYNQVVVFKSTQYTDRKSKKQINGEHRKKWTRYLLELVSLFKWDFIIQRQRRWPMYDRNPN